MWTLPKPAIDEVATHLERALERDRGAPPYNLTPAELDAVVAGYDHYDANGGIFTYAWSNAAIGRDLSKAIHDAYDQVQLGGRLEQLRQQIKSRARLCPYCSSPQVTDLDHYAPRSIYKDFAIYPRNLVPSCHPCNKIKRVFTASSDESLIHPYFDELPDGVFLIARTEVPVAGGLVATFDINMSADPTSEVLERAQFQLDLFKLNKRLPSDINVFLAGLGEALRYLYASGTVEASAAVSGLLAATATSHAANFGKNDWRTALLRSLAENTEFCAGGFERALGGLWFGDRLA